MLRPAVVGPVVQQADEVRPGVDVGERAAGLGARMAMSTSNGSRGHSQADLSPQRPGRRAGERRAGGGAGRAPAQYRDWRRAHWTRNTRVHLLDEHGRPSGPVYGPAAIANETFTRRRTRAKGTWANEHLPRAPARPPSTRWTHS